MKKFNDSLKSKYILAGITAFCLVLIVLSFVTDAATGPLRYIAGYVITPVQNGLNEVGNWITDKSAYFQSSTDLVAENKELQEKVDALTAENSQLLQDKEELSRLQALFELDQQYDDYEKIGARIIAKDTGNWFHSFVIDKGEEDGVAVDMNVIAGSGLVGRVVDTGPNWAKVTAIIADNSNVSGKVLATSDYLLVEGDLELYGSGFIRFEKLVDSADKVVVGDKIVTSNISDKYLPNILIGYINTLNVDANNITKSGQLTPAVDFEHLEEVLVILQLKQSIEE